MSKSLRSCGARRGCTAFWALLFLLPPLTRAGEAVELQRMEQALAALEQRVSALERRNTRAAEVRQVLDRLEASLAELKRGLDCPPAPVDCAPAPRARRMLVPATW